MTDETSKPDPLTDEQKAIMDEVRERWIGYAMSTDEIDVEKSLAALKQVYEETGLPWPDKHVVCDSPRAAVDYMWETYGMRIRGEDFLFPAHESWLCTYEAHAVCVNLGEELIGKLRPHIVLAENCGPYLAMDEIVILCRRPTEITQLSDDKYRIRFRDGSGSG